MATFTNESERKRISIVVCLLKFRVLKAKSNNTDYEEVKAGGNVCN